MDTKNKKPFRIKCDFSRDASSIKITEREKVDRWTTHLFSDITEAICWCAEIVKSHRCLEPSIGKDTYYFTYNSSAKMFSASADRYRNGVAKEKPGKHFSSVQARYSEKAIVLQLLKLGIIDCGREFGDCDIHAISPESYSSRFCNHV